MKILITGSRGFIGSHLGNRLNALGYEVYGVDDNSHPCKNKIDFLDTEEDAAVYTGAAITAFDVIFHLAAHINVDESIENPAKYMENNVTLTLKYLEAMREHNYKGKFIYASSAEVYGTAQSEKMDELHPLDPGSPYAVSKLSAEQLCKNYAQLYGLDIQVIRNFNTFGEYQRGDHYGGVISKFAHLAKAGKDLPVYGTGEQSRDYMHIKQAVEGYILAMTGKLPLIVNFGSGVPIRIIDIANFIAKEFGVKVVHEKPRPNEIKRLEADVGRALACGYKIETEFWENLQAYLLFIKNQVE